MSLRDTSSRPQIQCFLVQSSDVISDLRINVLEEGTDRVLWYKERYLTDDEIVESIYDNARSTVLWTIHRPKRGWYIRIRAPSFPPNSFITLGAVPRASAHFVDGALMFGCRTNVPQSPRANRDAVASSSNGMETPTLHSYPPTPTATSENGPPSPATVSARLSQVGTSSSARSSAQVAARAVAGGGPPPPQRITQFILAPIVAAPPTTETERPSFFARALALVKTAAPHHTSSFTLSPLSPAAEASLGAIASPSSVALTSTASSSTAPTTAPHAHSRRLSQLSHVTPGTPPPLLVFHDRTSAFNLRSTTGVIELDAVQARALGVQLSFWIAVALTYLEFISEREGYLAASADVA